MYSEHVLPRYVSVAIGRIHRVARPGLENPCRFNHFQQRAEAPVSVKINVSCECGH